MNITRKIYSVWPALGEYQYEKLTEGPDIYLDPTDIASEYTNFYIRDIKVSNGELTYELGFEPETDKDTQEEIETILRNEMRDTVRLHVQKLKLGEKNDE